MKLVGRGRTDQFQDLSSTFSLLGPQPHDVPDNESRSFQQKRRHS